MRAVQIATVVCFFAASPAFAFELRPVGDFQIGEGEGYAEMLRYHAPSRTIMVTASETGTIERIDTDSG